MEPRCQGCRRSHVEIPVSRIHEPLFKGLTNFSLARRMSGILLLVAAYCGLVSYIAPGLTSGKALLETNSALFVGVILSLLLVFRTNSAYERWWEGRRLWGQLVNEIRNAAAKADQLLDLPADERRQFGQLMIEFAYALKDHLRAISDEAEHTTAPKDSGISARRNPMVVVHDLYGLMGKWMKVGTVDRLTMLMLDPHVRSLADVLGACERICLSPITQGHKSMLLHMIFIYILFLPWALAPSLGYWDIPFVIVGVYMVLGLEVVAEGKEHPFGVGEEDLPLERLCATIETSVVELLKLPGPSSANSAPAGDRELPSP